MMNSYINLLKTWCDRLMDLQITDKKDPELYGAIICPACGIIHGRCADAIYPMLTLADILADRKYVKSAKLLFNWTEHNLKRSDNSYYNDSTNPWKGITVFSALGIASALFNHGFMLDRDTRERWKIRLSEECDFLSDYIEEVNCNVNYRITMCAALATAAKVLKNPKYDKRAKEYAEMVYPLITEENLIFGEGHPYNSISKKGCRPIDIGYNVEESIPALAIYAKLTGDKKMMDLVEKLLHTHLDFMLPDGGFDNSFGSRMAKWTYWGSRTSDGCLPAFAMLADKDPIFAEATERSFKLLERCTKNGLLHGGPMYISAKESPCVHHTFCHAKAVADIIDSKFTHKNHCKLPNENANFVKYYKSLHVSLVGSQYWRATISDYDCVVPSSNLYSTGGTMTLLRHKDAGMIFAASMPSYFLVEPTNMQFSRHTNYECNTPRIEYYCNGTLFSSMYDDEAVVTRTAGKREFKATGALKDSNKNGTYSYAINYDFDGQNAVIYFFSSALDSELVLPVIASSDEEVTLKKTKLTVKKPNCTVNVELNCNINSKYSYSERNFNPVGGFETYPITAKLGCDRICKVTISVK